MFHKYNIKQGIETGAYDMKPICVASLQSHCRKNKKLRFFLILIEQVMTNLLKKKLAF